MRNAYSLSRVESVLDPLPCPGDDECDESVLESSVCTGDEEYDDSFLLVVVGVGSRVNRLSLL